MTTPPARARRRHGPHRDPQIDENVLAATRELLIRHGYAGVSIDLIATTAGVSRPAIYRRWPSKAHLVHEAVFVGVDARPRPDGDFAAEVAAMVHGAVHMFAEPATRAAIPGLMAEIRSDPALQQILAARLETAARGSLTHLLPQAVADGAARPGTDPDTLFDTIAGAAIFALCIRDVDDLDALVDSLTDLVLHGTLAPRG
ncbi:TetR/AcrR family transcriptional regulator [Yinghuangia soli]|uniref:TetR/AcrR family transcriptional regulator n=1 Tax=Yinghuangia soli TaxID=2908204 RepID=A0AA41U206_9ACTN|nr:TetR/AcrR family transcriptional regulator [Yinghuangia soli]MCF2530175.1 TetR/AcrR family transcriptional regulator [Yinghuangia soli]